MQSFADLLLSPNLYLSLTVAALKTKTIIAKLLAVTCQSPIVPVSTTVMKSVSAS